MADTTNSRRSGLTTGMAFYRAVWKWHFIASLFVLPFMLLMALSGTVNLFHDELNEAINGHRLNVPAGEAALPYAELAASASVAAPGRITKFFTPETDTRSIVFEIETAPGTFTDVWINPYTAEVLAAKPKTSQTLWVIEHLHTQLLAGQTGKYVVEALSCWAIVMFITGLYLWWPRNGRSWRQAFALPSGNGRGFWRALHLWAGFFTAIIIVPIIFSGLFWTTVWGGAYLNAQLSMKHFSPGRAYGGPPVFATSQDGPVLPMDTLIANARAGGLGDAMLEARPPVAPKFAMLVRTDEKYPMDEQMELHIDTRSGEIVKQSTYGIYPPMAYFRSWMARFHLGMLGNGVGTVFNLAGLVLLILLSVSGFVSWWMRRPAGSIGVPAAPADTRLGIGMVALIVALGAFFPLMGATLVAALLLDWLVLQRVGWLQPAGAR